MFPYSFHTQHRRPTLEVDIGVSRPSDYSVSRTHSSKSLRYAGKWNFSRSLAHYGHYVVATSTYDGSRRRRVKMRIKYLAARVRVVVLSRTLWNRYLDSKIELPVDVARNSARHRWAPVSRKSSFAPSPGKGRTSSGDGLSRHRKNGKVPVSSRLSADGTHDSANTARHSRK